MTEKKQILKSASIISLVTIASRILGYVRDQRIALLLGTTFAAEAVAEPPPVGVTMTWVAVIVVPLVVPSARTVSPAVMAFAEVELVPFRYVAEDAVSTVTFRPADVEIAKLDVDTLTTVPAAPPAAGPERALDPPLPGTPCGPPGGPPR